ncbi:MAG: transcriptional regulator [Woeseiaceae bacterium]|nr:transcriptional regulator [Woeseiaceae bacterium]
MKADSFAFDRFVLDTENRQLTRDGTQVELNSRYLDALALLVAERGQLVSKDRFLDEVWKGVPVTDEVITQCVKTLRKRLGDSASNPRFIETIPKHGYRFIAPVEQISNALQTRRDNRRDEARERFLALGTAGIAGGGVAGVVGGLLYGFAAASQALQPGTGAISVLLVVASMTILMAVIGGTGVAFGIAAATTLFRPSWFTSVAGGAIGGMLVGAAVKLIGIDAFNLFFGQSPGDITGAAEGILLGGAVGLAVWMASSDTRPSPAKRLIAAAALIGAGAGTVIALLGGRLMVGSLDLLVRQFSGTRFRLDRIGHLFGENGFGELTQIVTNSVEGALFAVCIVGVTMVARRSVT